MGFKWLYRNISIETDTTLVGAASERLHCRLELRDVLLTSEATLAESESRSSHDPALLDPGLGLRLPDT